MVIEDIKRALYCDPILYDYLTFTEDKIYNEMFEGNESLKRIYPCNILKLRRILERGYVSGDPLLLYSLEISRKYLRKYPVFLVFNLRETNVNYENYGQVIYMDNKLTVSNLLKSIIINTPVLENVVPDVQKILKETHTNIEIIEEKQIS